MFRPDLPTFKLGSLSFDKRIKEDVPLHDTPVRKLPFFKLILANNVVAVAMGRSGSFAIWTRMT